MLLSCVNDFCGAAYEHVLQFAPVFFIPIDNQGHARVLNDIQDSLQLRWASSLRFLVDRAIERVPVVYITNRDNLRLAILR
jgi:hypothetical protein